jgi:hypothetical protein
MLMAVSRTALVANSSRQCLDADVAAPTRDADLSDDFA